MSASDNWSEEINADGFLQSQGIHHTGFIATGHIPDKGILRK
jgi:hypothetical protein